MKNGLLLYISVLAGATFASSIAAKDAHSSQDETSEKQETVVQQEDAADKMQLIISGAATVHANFGKPRQKYYEKNPKGYEKSDKDTSMPRFNAAETNIEFKGVKKFGNGTKVSAVIDFDAIKDDTGVDKMYISASKDGWGTLQAGNVKGPEAKCIYSGQQLLGGTGGLDGTIPSEFDFAAAVQSPLYPLGQSKKATKLAAYSPQMGTPQIGYFQLGFAITPDTKQHGHNDKDRHAGCSSNGNDNGMFQKGSGSQKPSGRNNLAFSLTYEHKFQNGMGIKLSGVYVCEDTRPVTVKSYERDVDATGKVTSANEITKKVELRNVSAYMLSGTVTYKQWSVGAGFLDNGRSRTPKDNLSETKTAGTGDNVEGGENGIPLGKTRYSAIGNFLGTHKSDAGKAWNVGVKYEFDEDWTFSSVYHSMRRKVDSGSHTKGHAFSAAAEYKICDGLMTFIEYDYVYTKSCNLACERYNAVFKDIKEKNAIMKQTANLLVLGVKASF